MIFLEDKPKENNNTLDVPQKVTKPVINTQEPGHEIQLQCPQVVPKENDVIVGNHHDLEVTDKTKNCEKQNMERIVKKPDEEELSAVNTHNETKTKNKTTSEPLNTNNVESETKKRKELKIVYRKSDHFVPVQDPLEKLEEMDDLEAFSDEDKECEASQTTPKEANDQGEGVVDKMASLENERGKGNVEHGETAEESKPHQETNDEVMEQSFPVMQSEEDECTSDFVEHVLEETNEVIEVPNKESNNFVSYDQNESYNTEAEARSNVKDTSTQNELVEKESEESLNENCVTKEEVKAMTIEDTLSSPELIMLEESSSLQNGLNTELSGDISFKENDNENIKGDYKSPPSDNGISEYPEIPNGLNTNKSSDQGLPNQNVGKENFHRESCEKTPFPSPVQNGASNSRDEKLTLPLTENGVHADAQIKRAASHGSVPERKAQEKPALVKARWSYQERPTTPTEVVVIEEITGAEKHTVEMINPETYGSQETLEGTAKGEPSRAKVKKSKSFIHGISRLFHHGKKGKKEKEEKESVQSVNSNEKETHETIHPKRKSLFSRKKTKLT